MSGLSRQLFDAVVALAQRAGEATLAFYEQPLAVEHKADASPLTQADLAAHRCIVEGLATLTPSLPVLSEESAAISFAEREAWSSYWLVDPLDGTKEFIKGNGEFTVNIALIEQGEPRFGVVYAPALGVTYWGAEGLGAWKLTADGYARPLVAPQSVPDSWRVVGSRSHPSAATEAFCQALGEYQLKPTGSSLKICLVASGEADVYPRLGPTSEWDIAAAHAVLRAAEGELIDLGSGLSKRYNQQDSVLNNSFIAAGRALFPALQPAIDAISTDTQPE